jgi:uncharacterized BrkB/YihY/UPF0761 family membrane protein
MPEPLIECVPNFSEGRNAAAVEAIVTIYVLALPWMNLDAVYGPFSVSVGLMLWAFLTGLILLAGAQFSATRHTLRLARKSS